MSTLEKIEKAVVEGYQKIENGVVEGYQKIEDGVVEGYKKIEEGAVEGFKKVDNGRIDKISNAVTKAFGKMTDGFVEKCLTREGESVEEAKVRLAKEQENRDEQAKEYKNIQVEIPNSNEIVKKNLEASLNAGKRNI